MPSADSEPGVGPAVGATEEGNRFPSSLILAGPRRAAPGYILLRWLPARQPCDRARVLYGLAFVVRERLFASGGSGRQHRPKSVKIIVYKHKRAFGIFIPTMFTNFKS